MVIDVRLRDPSGDSHLPRRHIYKFHARVGRSSIMHRLIGEIIAHKRLQQFSPLLQPPAKLVFDHVFAP